MKLSAFVYTAIGLLMKKYADKSMQDDLSKTLDELEHDYGLPRIRSWDFIIVGGGQAGCLLAERLSHKFHVLLLEKGGDPPPSTHNKNLPFFFNAYTGPDFNDFYNSVPQQNAYLWNHGDAIYPSGRMLGGSGSHNLNVYNRGSPLDYNLWANVTGDPTWSYQHMLPHFKSLESFSGFLIHGNERTKYYGHDGPVSVVVDTFPVLPIWFRAGQELGYQPVDSNGFQMPGFSSTPRTVRDGLKESGYTAFLKNRAIGRPTLTIQRYSMVEEILFDKDNKAYGVSYKRHGMPQIAHAKKEVIVSAGPFGSPSLLIKSGIGPANLLKEAGIPLVIDHPGVGATLKDHISFPMLFTISHVDLARKWLPIIKDDQVIDELKKFNGGGPRHGFYASYLGPQAFVVSSIQQKIDPKWADIQLSWLSVPTIEPERPVLHLQVIVGQPKSMGHLVFNTTLYKTGERDDTALINPDFKYLTDPLDMPIAIEAAHYGLRVLEGTTIFKPYGIKFDKGAAPMCKMTYNTTEFWECYIKFTSITIQHASATCRMGAASDKMAVLDSKLRVKGAKSLRVIDSSVFTKTPNANTNAATLGVAEKLAHDILAEYSKSDPQ